MCSHPFRDRAEAGRREKSLAKGEKCCSDVVWEQTADILQVFAEEKVPHFLAFGALLGSVRDQDLIPHDVDVDIVVEQHQVSCTTWMWTA